MTNSRTVFISYIYYILGMKNADTQVKMMAINGLMIGHGVTWRTMPKHGLNIHSGPFMNMHDYFIYHINNGYTLISTLCHACMDFTILEAGNRVNMMVNDGPY